MKKELKDQMIQFRITKTEKQEVYKNAEKQGFDTASHFFMWLYRKYGKK